MNYPRTVFRFELKSSRHNGRMVVYQKKESEWPESKQSPVGVHIAQLSTLMWQAMVMEGEGVIRRVSEAFFYTEEEAFEKACEWMEHISMSVELRSLLK